MATSHLSASSFVGKSLPRFQSIRPSMGIKVSLRYPAPKPGSFQGLVDDADAASVTAPQVSLRYPAPKPGSFQGLVDNADAASVTAPQFTSIKPLGDLVLIKAQTVEEKTAGGILVIAVGAGKGTGEVIAVGAGKGTGEQKVPVSVKVGSTVMYSMFSGTELELSGSTHLLLKEDDIIGVLETEDVKDLKPLKDGILVKVAEAEGRSAVGLYLTEAAKTKRTFGTVIAVGPGHVDAEDGNNSQPLPVSHGDTVLFSKYAGSDLKGKDGSDYVALRASDVVAVLFS